MVDNDSIKAFVQNTLGCGCPDEVFRLIDWRPHVRLSDEVTLAFAVTIGDRLLVYVTERDAVLDEVLLTFLVSRGKKERDARGLNRFRLVVATDDAATREGLMRKFEELCDRDKKIHLHLITKADSICTAGVELHSG
jgi:hypothetical protein